MYHVVLKQTTKEIEKNVVGGKASWCVAVFKYSQKATF